MKFIKFKILFKIVDIILLIFMIIVIALLFGNIIDYISPFYTLITIAFYFIYFIIRVNTLSINTYYKYDIHNEYNTIHYYKPEKYTQDQIKVMKNKIRKNLYEKS